MSEQADIDNNTTVIDNDVRMLMLMLTPSIDDQLVNSKQLYNENLSSMHASSIEPNHVASTWASGSQKYSG